jgi:hypothetical protein
MWFLDKSNYEVGTQYFLFLSFQRLCLSTPLTVKSLFKLEGV